MVNIISIDYSDRLIPTNNIIPVIAKPHTPPYMIHKYFARRPWNVFEQLIQVTSLQNETILDPFCGGGVTLYEGYKNRRKVIGFDINPLATFIIRNMLKKSIFKKELYQAIDECRLYLRQLYKDNSSFKKGNREFDVSWIESSFEVKCNVCGHINVLSNDKKISNGKYICGNKKCQTNHNKKKGFVVKDCQRVSRKYLFLVHINNRKLIIKKVNEFEEKRIDSHVRKLKSLCLNESVKIEKTPIPLKWDRQFEDQLKQKGINNFEDLFTERNLLINSLLRNKIMSMKNFMSDYNYELLRLAFSNVVKESNIMSFTNEGWQSGKPTTWSKHAYWIPSQFCEVNIMTVFENSIKRILRSLEFNDRNLSKTPKISSKYNEKSDVILIDGSIDEVELPDNSVDSIVTDPPYGSNVQYLELSHFWYIWNKDLYSSKPNFNKEAVANRKKFESSKSMYDYEDILYPVFRECMRVLKPGKFMTMTFNNKDISAWLALLLAIFRSGFSFTQNGIIFQDGIENYKQTAHTKFKGSPFGDFIYIFQKVEGSFIEKRIHSEDELIMVLDKLFKYHINNSNVKNRNELKKEMFLEAIPYIEDFAKNLLKVKKEHKLFRHFNKVYLKKLYT